jgi:hypothetical protein
MCKRELPKPGHHLFIAPRTNMDITPSLGEFSDRPDAPIELTGRAGHWRAPTTNFRAYKLVLTGRAGH